MPLTQLKRIEVLFGTVGSTEQCFIEFTNASATAESRLAFEILEVGGHLDMIGTVLLICGRQDLRAPPVVGVESSELSAWLDAHKSQPGAHVETTSAV